MSEQTNTPSAAAIRAAEALYGYIDEQAQSLLFGDTREGVIDGVAQIIDDETGLPGLLAACRKLANIAEAVGHCVGTWTPEHAAVAREYAAEGREAIAAAGGGV